MLMMLTLGQKIRAARTEAGLTQTALAERLNVSRNAVSQWESDTTAPATTTLLKLASIVPLEVDGIPQGLPETVEGLPVMGEVRAGMWLEIDGEQDDFGAIPVAQDPLYRGSRQYALKVVGTSMNKVAQPGSYVIVADWSDNGGELKDGELVVVRRERAQTYEVTLKRAKKGKDTWELWPESDDPRHQEPIAMTDGDRDVEVIVVGKVIGKYERL